MKTIISISLLTQFSFGLTIGLEVLLENAQQPKQIQKMIRHEFNALESKSLADTQVTPLHYNHALSRSLSTLQQGYEHEIGFSKAFKLGNVQALEQESNRLNNEAQSLEQEKLLVTFSNRLKNAYHQYCLNRNYVSLFQERYDEFSLLYAKKQKAYAQDEISKTELLQIELEKQTLNGELECLMQTVDDEKNQLLSYGSFNAQNHIGCQEMYPLSAEFVLKDNGFELSNKAYEKRIKSTQLALKRQSKKIDSIEISTSYLRELERDVYTISISVPLNFSSDSSKYERASLMEHSSALSLQNEQLLRDKQYEVTRLKSKLHSIYDAIANQEENIEAFKSKLLPLIKKSYHYGESSVVEYLLSQQQLRAKEEALLAQKRGYYETLFTLYNINEKR